MTTKGIYNTLVKGLCLFNSKYGHPDPPFLGRSYIAKGRSIRLDETPLDSCGHGKTAHIQFVLSFTASFIFRFSRQFQRWKRN